MFMKSLPKKKLITIKFKIYISKPSLNDYVFKAGFLAIIL